MDTLLNSQIQILKITQLIILVIFKKAINLKKFNFVHIYNSKF